MLLGRTAKRAMVCKSSCSRGSPIFISGTKLHLVKLAAIGIKDNELNLKNKIGRGTFSAAFFVQCLEAIGVHTLHLNGD